MAIKHGLDTIGRAIPFWPKKFRDARLMKRKNGNIVLRFVLEDGAPVSIELADGHVTELIRMLEKARRDQGTGDKRMVAVH